MVEYTLFIIDPNGQPYAAMPTETDEFKAMLKWQLCVTEFERLNLELNENWSLEMVVTDGALSGS